MGRQPTPPPALGGAHRRCRSHEEERPVSAARQTAPSPASGKDRRSPAAEAVVRGQGPPRARPLPGHWLSSRRAQPALGGGSRGKERVPFTVSQPRWLDSALGPRSGTSWARGLGRVSQQKEFKSGPRGVSPGTPSPQGAHPMVLEPCDSRRLAVPPGGH